MPSINGNAPGGQARGVSAEPLPSDEVGSQRAHRIALPRVRARLLAPCGRRRLPVLVVPAGACPWCSGAHIHRGEGGPRTAGCCSREYFLLPIGVPATIRRAA